MLLEFSQRPSCFSFSFGLFRIQWRQLERFSLCQYFGFALLDHDKFWLWKQRRIPRQRRRRRRCQLAPWPQNVLRNSHADNRLWHHPMAFWGLILRRRRRHGPHQRCMVLQYNKRIVAFCISGPKKTRTPVDLQPSPRYVTQAWFHQSSGRFIIASGEGTSRVIQPPLFGTHSPFSVLA